MNMRLATWNVNSLTVRLPQVLDWLAANPVEVLCLQELKLQDDKFPLQALQDVGYHSAVFGQKTYNGVATLSRMPLYEIDRNIAGFEDLQSRVISTTINSECGPVRVVNCYFVNGQAPGSEKFIYKMRWLEALHDLLSKELTKYSQLVLLGDFNVAPEDRDSFDPEGLRDTIHHTQEERTHFQALLDLGMTDTFRMFDQPEKSYSWWDYRMLGFQKNKGLRIDHILVSNALKPKVLACSIDRNPRKNQQPSDHTPVVITLGT